MVERPDPREPFWPDGYDCPDCGGIFYNGKCQSCDLEVQDMADAVQYFDDLDDAYYNGIVGA